jgi:hypothetical protein
MKDWYKNERLPFQKAALLNFTEVKVKYVNYVFDDKCCNFIPQTNLFTGIERVEDNNGKELDICRQIGEGQS